MKLVVANDTIFKLKPEQASTLDSGSKVSVKAGESHDIASVEAVAGSHLKVTFRNPFFGSVIWYVFSKHVVAKDDTVQGSGGPLQPGTFRFNSIAKDLIERAEGYEETAYCCPAGVWTFGVGFTRHLDGSPVQEGDTLTREESDKIFAHEMEDFVDALNRLVEVPLTGKQVAALQSFVFNCGWGAFEESTLRKVINNGGTLSEIQAQIKRWDNGGLGGLVRRREAECNLWAGKEHGYE